MLRDEPPLPFDHLILAAGSSTNCFGVPGAAEYAFPLYGLEDAVRVRNHLLSLFEAADAIPELVDDGVLNLVVVGGGPTGVEVAGAMAELVDKVLRQDFHDLDVRRSRVILIEQAPHLLAPFSEKSRRYARKMLEARGVEVRLGRVVDVGGEGPPDPRRRLDRPDPSRPLGRRRAGVRPGRPARRRTQGRGGRIVVGPDLSIPGHPDAYAIGDVADIDDGRGGRLPQLAQVAIQGGAARRRADPGARSSAGRARRSTTSTRAPWPRSVGGQRWPSCPAGSTSPAAIAWLAWLGLHLVYLLGVRNRVSVFVNWAWNYLTWDRGPRLILRPEVLPHTPHPISDLLRRPEP